MSEMNFKKESNDRKYNIEVDRIFDSALEGEGSEGLQSLETLNETTKEFLWQLHLIHAGEGESFQAAVTELQDAGSNNARALANALEGDTLDERLLSAATLTRDLDRHTQTVVGDKNVWFAEVDDEEAVGSIIEGLKAAVEQANPESDQEALEYYSNGLRDLIISWHETVMSSTVEDAEANQNDLARERKEARIRSVKKFARDAGAAALGSLPIVGAAIYMNRKKK